MAVFLETLRFLFYPKVAKSGLAFGTVMIVTDEVFNFVLAPIFLLFVFVIVALAESYSAYRCCSDKVSFEWGEQAKGKLALVAVVVGAMGLDAMVYIISRTIPDKFPFLSQIDVPVVTMLWTAWLIFAEVMSIRKNVQQSEGDAYVPPLVGPAFDVVEKLRQVDRERAGGEIPRRRWSDREEVVREVLEEGTTETEGQG